MNNQPNASKEANSPNNIEANIKDKANVNNSFGANIKDRVITKLVNLIKPADSYLPNKSQTELTNKVNKKKFFGLVNDRIKGVIIKSHKNDSNKLGRSVALPILPVYRISIMQRTGELAIPVVKVSDYVLKGQIIAVPTSKVALYRHAPTSGKVVAIEDICELHPSKKIVPAITIASDFLDKNCTDFTPYPNYQLLDKSILLTRIYQSGIAGMGGAGFPAEKKIDLEHEVDTLIINGAECEPYLTCDDILMRESAEDILCGAQVIAHILAAKTILVGIESDKVEAVASMRCAAIVLNDARIKIIELPSFYPMGSRQQIAHYLLGKETIVGRRSYNYGFICHNVATAKAYYDAICLGQPSIERLITVAGDAISSPKVLKVRVGTSLSDIFSPDITKYNLQNDLSNNLADNALNESSNELPNSLPNNSADNSADNSLNELQNSSTSAVGLKFSATNPIDLVVGGTMMGFNIDYERSKQFVIKKETTSILAFTNKTELLVKKQEKNCIRCGDCANVCPINLLPQQLYFFGKAGQFDKTLDYRLFDCIECGCCAYVCPSEIPLVQYFQHSKGMVKQQREKSKLAENAKKRFENRLERIEAEKAEKAAKQQEKLRLLAQKAETKSETAIKSEVGTETETATEIAAVATGKNPAINNYGVSISIGDNSDAINSATNVTLANVNGADSNVPQTQPVESVEPTEPINIHNATGNEASLIAEALARSKAKKLAFAEQKNMQSNNSANSNILDKINE